LGRGSWVPILHNVAYLPTKWYLDPSSHLATTYGPKIGDGCAPLGEGGPGSPSNTMWPGPRPTCVPTFILVRPTVWPQYTNVTDRTDRQTDNGPIAWGEPFYKRSSQNLEISGNLAAVREMSAAKILSGENCLLPITRLGLHYSRCCYGPCIACFKDFVAH